MLSFKPAFYFPSFTLIKRFLSFSTFLSTLFTSVQSLSPVQLFETPWTAACQASLFITSSWGLLKVMSIIRDAIQPSYPLPSPSLAFNLFQQQGLFQWVILHIRWPKLGVSAWASVLPTNIQDWFPLILSVWISLQSKGLWRIFCNTTVQNHQFFVAPLSL